MKLTKSQLKEMRLYPCIACGKTPTDVAHIKSKGSGGTMDDWNLLSLCRICHRISHDIGWKKFLEKNESVKKEIILKGWEIIYVNGLTRFKRK